MSDSSFNAPPLSPEPEPAPVTTPGLSNQPSRGNGLAIAAFVLALCAWTSNCCMTVTLMENKSAPRQFATEGEAFAYRVASMVTRFFVPIVLASVGIILGYRARRLGTAKLRLAPAAVLIGASFFAVPLVGLAILFYGRFAR